MLGKRYVMDGVEVIELNELQRNAKNKFLKDIYAEDSMYEYETYYCECGAGEEDFEVLAEKDRYGLPVRTVICKKCGIVMTNPRMTQDSYNYFYANIFAKLYRGDDGNDDIGARFRKQVARGKYICDFVEKYMEEPIQNVLEIGCAAGGILYAFKEKGYQVTGVDLDDEYLEYGRGMGLDLRLGHSSELLKENKKFDLIILCHVFEHFLDIENELEVIRNLLSESGVVYIEVPGIKMLKHGTYDGDFLLYLQNAHIRNFTLSTLTNVMIKYGFKLHVGSELIQSLYKYTGECKPLIDNFYKENKMFLIQTEIKKLEQMLQEE